MLRWAANAYRKTVHKDLAKYGLRYQDVLNEFDEDTRTAIKHLSKDEAEGRNRRLRRAIDLSMKHADLPAEILAQQTPEKEYLTEGIAQAEKLRTEREILMKDLD